MRKPSIAGVIHCRELCEVEWWAQVGCCTSDNALWVLHLSDSRNLGYASQFVEMIEQRQEGKEDRRR